jgi:hypothetical protein
VESYPTLAEPIVRAIARSRHGGDPFRPFDVDILSGRAGFPIRRSSIGY